MSQKLTPAGTFNDPEVKFLLDLYRAGRLRHAGHRLRIEPRRRAARQGRGDAGGGGVPGPAHPALKRARSGRVIGVIGADGFRVGALYSSSGINVWTANIVTNNAGIGVALDPRTGHHTPDSSYFVNDYRACYGRGREKEDGEEEKKEADAAVAAGLVTDARAEAASAATAAIKKMIVGDAVREGRGPRARGSIRDRAGRRPRTPRRGRPRHARASRPRRRAR